MTDPRWYDRIRLEHILIGLGTIMSVALVFTRPEPGTVEDTFHAAATFAAVVALLSGFAISVLSRELRKELAELKQDPLRCPRRHHTTPHLEGGTEMTQHILNSTRTAVAVLFLALITPTTLLAQNPWEDAVSNLNTAMTGPIAKGLAGVAIVVGGMMFAFGEGGSKRTMAGIIFGLGMALAAQNFITWLF